MTAQQLADLSSVSKSTIDRLLRNEPGFGISAQNLFDIADAVGYKAEARAEDPAIQRIADLYEARIRQTEIQNNHLIRHQAYWIRILAALCVFLFMAIIAVLLYDVTHPNVGWIRDHLKDFAGDGLQNAMLAVADWWKHILTGA